MWAFLGDDRLLVEGCVFSKDFFSFSSFILGICYEFSLRDTKSSRLPTGGSAT